MSSLSVTTAGESHGPYELCILEGIPAGLALTTDTVDAELARRQIGYGRGGRMAIETDRCEFTAGIRLGRTLGSPIGILVQNKDHANWLDVMGVHPSEVSGTGHSGSQTPRPGHADYAGMAKYGFDEIRPVLERASARETVARVAAGAVCKRMLEELGVTVRGRVTSVGSVVAKTVSNDFVDPGSIDWLEVEASPVGCDDAGSSAAMCEAIDEAKSEGESLGGVFEVWAWGMCPGLGDHTSLDRRLDGRVLGALGSIPAIKGVEIGRAFDDAARLGSTVHDEFVLAGEGLMKSVTRTTNRAGGIEGGMTNGMPLVVRAAMKPIPTLTKPLGSVDLGTLSATLAHVERSDVTAVPAARVVAESMMAVVLAETYLDKFGSDTMDELTTRVAAYVAGLEERGLWHRL